MARDRANIFTDIWASGEWRVLSMPAQWLYFALLTHPKLSYAGVTDWRPGRLAAVVSDGTPDLIRAAGDELMCKKFVLIDEMTEEVLVRSFIKHDGLLKQPKLTVSMCNAFAGVASAALREVIAFEVQKLHDREPDLRAWSVPQMQTVLWEKATPIESFLDGFTPEVGAGFTHSFTPGFTPTLGQGLALPTSTATTTATPLQVKGGTGDESPPSPFCKRHEKTEGTDQPCRGCKLAAERYDAFMEAAAPADEPYVHVHRMLDDRTCMTCEYREETA